MGIWFYNSVALSLRLFCSLSSSPFLPAFLADKPVKFFCSPFVLQNLNPEESKKERKKEKQSFKGKAKLASSSYMEDGDEYRHWDELIPDALGLIFSNLSLQEILTVVPRVCKSWSRAGPYCWQEINIEEWTTRCHPDHLDRMLEMLITRSYGSLPKVCVSGLNNDTIVGNSDWLRQLESTANCLEEYSDDYDDDGRLGRMFYEGEDAELYGWCPSP